MEKRYIIENELGEPIICNSNDYVKYILNIIKNTKDEKELGRKMKNEYETLKLSLLILLDEDIEEIPY